jgi:hypothetical protein
MPEVPSNHEAESRLNILPDELLVQCAAIGESYKRYDMLERVMDQLPPALSQQEVSDLGDQIWVTVDRARPIGSLDGAGYQVSVQSLARIGLGAIHKEDYGTTRSICRHLRSLARERLDIEPFAQSVGLTMAMRLHQKRTRKQRLTNSV